MKHFLMIPFICNDYIIPLMECIQSNTKQPDKIFLIDNRQTNDDIPLRSSIEIFKPSIPLGVNASWNLGIKKAIQGGYGLISVFNDDLLIEKFFFEKLTRMTGKHLSGGVYCPVTVNACQALKNALQSDSGPCIGMKKREGWAWTIRAEVAKKIPPIPQELKTFCGDDWYWQYCRRLSRPWYKIIGLSCFHYIGVSVKQNQVRQDLIHEKRMLSGLL
jgi:GT2 family glycosyltransferase